MRASADMPGHLIRRLHQISTHIFHQRMQQAGYDLTPVQFAALDALADRPGIDQAGLAEAVAKDKATIGAVADRLAQKGLVARGPSSRDRRAKTLSLTPDGAAVLAAVLPVVEALQREILPGLDESEYRQFIALAAKAMPEADPDSPGRAM
ncbi:MarR family winged helix-turn-helix transcriptional regulator [Mangrovicoccus ximenensis]|uniref:MarR family winged helix-turn-helix transcriptional regulator n=1 Tax=Mangrovicoccus ximenensis TaxID=1911570 RepID=UPI000D336541|nr:MarR family transcriptional regulator [Mangrovicoccus ximenensis]